MRNLIKSSWDFRLLEPNYNNVYDFKPHSHISIKKSIEKKKYSRKILS